MRHTARALLTNSEGLCFLAIHNHYRPENIGKWGTVGGMMDPTDTDAKACLQRELAEEFKISSNDIFLIHDKITEIEKEGTIHHFFHVSTTLKDLTIHQPEEVLESRFFQLAEVQHLQMAGKLYFGQEADLFAQILK